MADEMLGIVRGGRILLETALRVPPNMDKFLIARHDKNHHLLRAF